MGVRKTETRLPAGLQPADLGEAVVAADGRCAIVSFVSSPLAPGHENTWVVFVTDAGLAASIKSYKWQIDADGSFPFSQTTDFGEVSFAGAGVGDLTLSVSLSDASGTELASLSMQQEVGPMNPALETKIEAAIEQPGPGVSNIEAVRELINDYYSYYQALTLKTPEGDDAFKTLVCNFIFTGILKNDYSKRRIRFTEIATAIDSNIDAFPEVILGGLGVCDIRLGLLAMNYPSGTPLLAWTEIPEETNANSIGDQQMRQQLATISENDKIDLVNIVRFPKTAIQYCGKIIEALRDKYFSGAKFNDVVTGMNGTRSVWIDKHYTRGPIAKQP